MMSDRPGGWTAEQIEASIRILGEHSSVIDALPAICAAVRRTVTYSALKGAFLARQMQAPATYTRRLAIIVDDAVEPDADTEPTTPRSFEPIRPPPMDTIAAPSTDPPTGSMSAIQEERRRQVYAETPEQAQALVRMLRVRPMPLYDVCEKLDIKPSDLSAIVEQSRAAGYHVAVNDGWMSAPKVPMDAAPLDFGGHTPGAKRHLVVSDLHIGSEHSAVEELTSFIEWGYAEGARVVHIPGDILDGVDSRLIYEQTRVGFQRQAEHCIRHMPELPGLRYLTVSGNHDQHAKDATGLDPGRALQNEFRIAGRMDWHHLGPYRVRYKVDGASFLAYHPNGGASRKHNVLAVCYPQIDREINDGRSAPDFFISGHLHKNVTDIDYRGTYSCACPTWQRQRGDFATRLSGKWDVGGMMIDYLVRDDGSVDGKGMRFFDASTFAKRRAVS